MQIDTVDDLIVAYLKDKRRRRHIGEDTEYSQRKSLEQFAKFTNHLPVEAYTIAVLTDWQAKCTEIGNSPKAINQKLGYIRGMFEWATLRGYFPEDRRNPAQGLRMKVRENPLDHAKPYTQSERMRLATALLDIPVQKRRSIHWQLILMAYTGLRNIEVLRLRHDELVLNHPVPHVTLERASAVKTESAYRRVPLPLELIKNFEIGYLKRFPKSDTNLITGHRAALALHANKWLQKTLPHGTAYTLRHTFATFLNDNEVPLDKLEELMGHRRTSISRRVYSKLTDLEILWPFTKHLSHLHPWADVKQTDNDQKLHSV